MRDSPLEARTRKMKSRSSLHRCASPAASDLAIVNGAAGPVPARVLIAPRFTAVARVDEN
jgi:hypothetical protein